MTVSSFEAIDTGRNCQYLGSWAKNQKSKDTLLSPTLKVEEKKVSLFFFIRGLGAKILTFTKMGPIGVLGIYTLHYITEYFDGTPFLG